jgi:hypothetical protein
MKEVGYVQKEAKGGLPYTFAGEAALIRALRPAMIKAGIHCYVADIVEINQESFTAKSGTVMNHVTAHGIVRFDHPISDTHIDVHAMGEGMDAGDKAGNKAATGLLKYALRQTFLIETGDDPDANSSAEMERAQAFADKQTPKSDARSKLYNKMKQAQWDEEQMKEFVDAYDGDYDKALEEWEAQHGGPKA